MHNQFYTVLKSLNLCVSLTCSAFYGLSIAVEIYTKWLLHTAITIVQSNVLSIQCSIDILSWHDVDSTWWDSFCFKKQTNKEWNSISWQTSRRKHRTPPIKLASNYINCIQAKIDWMTVDGECAKFTQKYQFDVISHNLFVWFDGSIAICLFLTFLFFFSDFRFLLVLFYSISLAGRLVAPTQNRFNSRYFNQFRFF